MHLEEDELQSEEEDIDYIDSPDEIYEKSERERFEEEWEEQELLHDDYQFRHRLGEYASWSDYDLQEHWYE